ncbi:hypothetical protein L198_02280 [Cryptococcus wingfieldii CBS 7118]|uniref:Chromo domain-containing protein n=1 Tax=Cryptococcus wingfieldii CBS 7118 TaxID=1295528 RepID=A0A1E3JRH8_9TREE|nr:hypothetical protein L198_02280 [Cryptococcus wingfieldii CBS 7118]ODO03433.1 hypothetical protein L198_02280 [Cryptococcus wingfieldii CBS 7118]
MESLIALGDMAYSQSTPTSPTTSVFFSSSSALGGEDLDDQGDVTMTQELSSAPTLESPIFSKTGRNSSSLEEGDGENDQHVSSQGRLGKRARALPNSDSTAKRPRAPTPHLAPPCDDNLDNVSEQSAILAAFAALQGTLKFHQDISEQSLRSFTKRLDRLQIGFEREMREVKHELHNNNEELRQVRGILKSLGLTSLVTVPETIAPVPTTPLTHHVTDSAARQVTPAESAFSGDKYIGNAMREAGIHTLVVGGQGRTVNFPFLSRPRTKKDRGINFSDTEEDTMTDHPSTHGDTNFGSENDESDLSSSSQPSPSQASDVSDATCRPAERPTMIRMRSPDIAPDSPTPTANQVSSPLVVEREEEGESEIGSDDPLDSVSNSVGMSRHGELEATKANRSVRGPSLISEQSLLPSDTAQRKDWVWKCQGDNTAKGRNWILECRGCTGRVHWACAGFETMTKWTKRDIYYCPGCWPLLGKAIKQQYSKQQATVEKAQQETCLRADCILHHDPVEDDDDQFAFESVVGRRYRKKGDPETVEFLIKWEQWALWDSTWEPPSALADFPYAKKRFEKQARAEGNSVGAGAFGERVILLKEVQEYFLPKTGKYNISFLKEKKLAHREWWDVEEKRAMS